MIAHNLKAILTLVPEARDMIKQASLEEDYPYDNKDSVCASYLRIKYLEKVAEKPVDPETKAFITKAANLHGVKERLDELSLGFVNIEKKASQEKSPFDLPVTAVEAGFEGDLSGMGFLSLEKVASAAQAIVASFGEDVTSPEVLRYAGKAYLNKQAAVIGLANRYHTTKMPEFVKVAHLVMDMSETDFTNINDLCTTVTQLDKQAGLDIVGFNFYREALLTKKADLISSMRVKLAGQDVPYESIQKFGKERISSAIGADIGKALNGDPGNDKAVLESMPIDLQKMLASLVKGI